MTMTLDILVNHEDEDISENFVACYAGDTLVGDWYIGDPWFIGDLWWWRHIAREFSCVLCWWYIGDLCTFLLMLMLMMKLSLENFVACFAGDTLVGHRCGLHLSLPSRKIHLPPINSKLLRWSRICWLWQYVSFAFMEMFANTWMMMIKAMLMVMAKMTEI